MDEIKWLEVTVNTTPDRLDEVCAKLAAAGMDSVVQAQLGGGVGAGAEGEARVEVEGRPALGNGLLPQPLGHHIEPLSNPTRGPMR